jgi:hypothetical protein
MLAVIAALQINRLSSPDMVLVMAPGAACDRAPRTPDIAAAFCWDGIPPR